MSSLHWRPTVLAGAALILLSACAGPERPAEPPRRPNIVFIFIDDLGYGDLSVTGNTAVETENLDRLAREGLLVEQFYVASPICSPSRVGITTGQFPARWGINSYLNNRARNRERGMLDFLDPEAPAVARTFHDAGYATAHFGKWHQGGGRDVGDAPLPQAYGFDESLVSFEGLGDRLLQRDHGLSERSAELGRGEIQWVPKHETTRIYVDRSIDFIQRHQDQPFYLHLWLNDVHDPFQPSDAQLAKFEGSSDNPYEVRFRAVLDAMDKNIGRLIDEIDALGLAGETWIVATGDNGPTAWPRYYDEGYSPPGSTAGLRGRKWSLYEGGIRQPLLVRKPGDVPAGAVDSTSVVGGVDLFPTFCALAGIEPPDVDFDGENRAGVFRGEAAPREKPLLWEYGRDESYLRPGLEEDRSPNVAIRDGKWKLLVNADGSRVELYDLEASAAERENLAEEHPDVAERLKKRALEWRSGLPTFP